MVSFLVLLAIYIFSVLTISSAALDTIVPNQLLKDGDTIISSGGSFELGFFSPGNSKNGYLGIWYKKISAKTVVWVANRQIPVNGRSGVLKIMTSGVLILLNTTNDTIWSTNSTSRPVQDPVAQLLENGNLIIKEQNDNSPDNFLWQSFDYPTDTQLPEMKLGKNFVTGLERHLTSWKNSDDPSPGEFTYKLDPTGYPHIVLRKGSMVTYQTGVWNGLRFSGRPSLSKNKIYTHKLIYNEEEVYYMFELTNASVLSRFVLNQSGEGQRWTWIDRTQNWEPFLKVPTDGCDAYRVCGAYGICSTNNGPICGCLDKFEPKFEDEWARADWSNGCVRKKSLDCRKGDGFLKYTHVKLPETVGSSWFDPNTSLKECRKTCLKNCSSMAYAGLNIKDGGSGCLHWFEDLNDIRELDVDGQDLFVRVASSDSGSNGRKWKVLIISISVSAGTVLLGLCLAVYVRNKRKNSLLQRAEGSYGGNSAEDHSIESPKGDLELPFFRLSKIAHATNNFSVNNKLGQGGFGPVFKGVLENGQEIAVKRLSETSKQGTKEFMNEVKFIAKLQHRNLVRLLGYCIHGDEKMLIYEYMPNKSLNSYLFDEAQSRLLDWPQRFHIINGIARGLLYLHQDSRLRIIHRDLKASNILLDSNMNPKISDFGMARSFKENETGANTNQIVGTYGYMSPEYAVDGLFSVKSDVFSFGVLILEIVSGNRNRGFIHIEHRHNLLGHAWRLHKGGRSLELVHAHIVSDSRYRSEMLRSIHIGLLCVQQAPEDRPNMSSVVLMLGGEGELPEPKQPGFFTERNIEESESISNAHSICPADETTSILLQGR